MAETYELAIVIPVYNEEAVIASVIEKWAKMARKLKLNFSICAYNDGSKDNSLSQLGKAAYSTPELLVTEKPNEGHGPSILRGYIGNLDAEWIFQVDSDDEMDPEHFPAIWEERGKYDFLIGNRLHRESPIARKAISAIARLAVSLFYGGGVMDVNCPYRLMRTASFSNLFLALNREIFAPNVIVSGYACARKLRILQVPVPFRPRTTGKVSIVKFGLFKAAVRSFLQTIAFRFRLPQ